MQKLLVGSDHWEAPGVTPMPTQSEPRELPALIYTAPLPPPTPHTPGSPLPALIKADDSRLGIHRLPG